MSDPSLKAVTGLYSEELKKSHKKAVDLWRSPELATMARKVEMEVEKKRFSVRNDRELNKDVGLKRQFLELLLSFTPLWLQLGLETVFNETIGGDLVALSRFVVTRMLSNPRILRDFAHPTVPNHFRPGLQEALKKHTLKKFLQLIHFLDKAKSLNLLDRRLFCKNSAIKATSDVLSKFSRLFLQGEGDILKHLAHLGYVVKAKQSTFDEFDFTLNNLAVDLRDGIRLARLVDVLTRAEDKIKIRLPATSRLQKIHNVDLALTALKKRSDFTMDIAARDVVDGHLEKTLNLISHLIFDLALKNVFNCDLKMGLLRWAKLICSPLEVEIDDLSLSFSDGVAFCVILNHYDATLLDIADVEFETTKRKTSEKLSYDEFDRLLANERRNFKLFVDRVKVLGGIPLLIRPVDMINTIPDEKVTTAFLAYLASRLFEHEAQTKAAKVIQIAWRNTRKN